MNKTDKRFLRQHFKEFYMSFLGISENEASKLLSGSKPSFKMVDNS